MDGSGVRGLRQIVIWNKYCGLILNGKVILQVAYMIETKKTFSEGLLFLLDSVFFFFFFFLLLLFCFEST